MPQLSEPLHESFSIHYAGGVSQTEAAKRAGYSPKTAHNTGSRLARRPEIKARVEELRQLPENQPKETGPSPSETFVSKAYVITEVVGVHKLALKTQQLATSMACLQLLARMGGHLESTKSNPQQAPRNLTQINLNAMSAKDMGVYLREMVADIPIEERRRLLAAIPEVEDIQATCESVASEGEE